MAKRCQISKVKGVDGTMMEMVEMEEIEVMEDRDLEIEIDSNMMAEEDETDDGAEEGDEDDLFCHISDYMAATGYDVYDMSEESTNE